MVASILAVQRQCQAVQSKCSVRKAPIDSGRVLPTPARQSGPCPKCGWLARGLPKRLALCACSFLEMDPFRPVESVVALVHLHANPHSSIEMASMPFTCREMHEDSVGVELRMARIGEPGKHIWPNSMFVSLDGCEMLTVHPPINGRVRHDAPLQLQCRGQVAGHLVELKAHPKLGQKYSEFVCCLVCVASARSIPDLVHTCISRPSMAYHETVELWVHLRDQANSVVECASPWLHPLRCPLTRERMRIPARGKKCQHIACFDLEAYLTVSARASFHRRWCCPVCACALPFTELIVCDFTKQLLNRATPDIAELPLEELCTNLDHGSTSVSQNEASCVQPAEATSRLLEISKSQKRMLWKEDILVQSQGAVHVDYGRSWGRRVRPNAGRQGALDLRTL